jgi:tripartite-type tricarboxylate transporter receptor subunit TctC
MAAALLPAVAPAGAADEAWPSRPIRFVLGHSPGGNADTFARALAEPLAQRLGQPVVVENKPGGNQIIAASLTAKSAPDGYTIYLASQSSLVLNVGARKKLPYDPVKDFAPVSLVYTIPLYLVVNPQVPAKSVRELVELAKAKPNSLTFGSVGTGSSVHLATEMFKSMTGVDMLHVPYRGSGEALLDLIPGRIHLMFDGGVSSLRYVKEGKLRALGMTGVKRSPATPEIPTIAESGVPGYAATFWFGVVAPAGTSPAIVERLSKEIGAIVDEPVFKKKFWSQGVDPVSSTPAEFSKLIKDDLPKWTAIMRQAGVVPE